MIAHFESLDAVEPYRIHPDHRSYVDDFLKPRLAVIKAWNFKLTTTAKLLRVTSCGACTRGTRWKKRLTGP